ncbi:MAG: MoxR family ATPase [Flavobacteriales bacterium]|jgi:MoxR-like ATPase|nr:MoxR family ATPase [Flavobacteriales bacterium]
MEEENKIAFESRISLEKVQENYEQIKTELRKVIVGQDRIIDLLFVSILANGHVLLEGVPGVAKTLLIKSISKTLGVDFSRIQFTPDLMPSDILGTSIFAKEKEQFVFKKGPIFSNTILIDEINRAPAKTQAALFEVMEEGQITIDGKRYGMEFPFFVLATQNPVDHEGTYRLPEAQMDRFLFKLIMGYPSLEDEIHILNLANEENNKKRIEDIQSILSSKDIQELQNLVSEVVIEQNLLEYIAKIIQNTRENPNLFLGASPRASKALLASAKAWALLQGRDFVTPEDIKYLAPAILEHRIHLTPEREMEGMENSQVIALILDSIEVPR